MRSADHTILSNVPPNRRPLKWFGYALIILAVITFGGMDWWLKTGGYAPLRTDFYDPDWRRVYGFPPQMLDSLTCVFLLMLFLAGLFGVLYTRPDGLEDISINPDRGGVAPRGLSSVTSSAPNTHKRGLWSVPVISATPQNRRPFKWLGLILIFVAIIMFGGMGWWLSTRDYSPFLGAVSLKPGHTRAPDFVLNFHADYFLRITLDSTKCQGRIAGGPQIHWRLLKSRLVIAEGEGDACLANGFFRAESGVYSLDLEVLPGHQRPADANTEVEILTSPDWGRVYGFPAEPLNDLIYLLSFVFFLAGLFGTLYTRADRLEDISISPDRGARIPGNAITFYSSRQLRARRPQLIPPLSNLRAFSYLAIQVLLVPWMIFVLLRPLTPVGLWVRIPRIGTLSPSRDPLNTLLTVRIDASGHTYLNREPVPVADVYQRLREQWSLRGDRAVYLDANPAVSVGTVITAVDEIKQATRANVVLVTPSMKSEDSWLDWISPCEREELYSGVLKAASIWKTSTADWSPYSAVIRFDVNERGDVSYAEIAKPSTWPGRDVPLLRRVKKLKFPAIPGCEIEHVLQQR